MPDDRHDAAQELEYPPIRVDRSLAQLDLHTLIMHSNPHPAQEATSLEDSTYELLDRVGYLSDDDGHTASVTSTSPDDVSLTLSETESEGDDDFAEHRARDAFHLAESSAADPLDTAISAAEDSTLTERPGLGESESSFHFTLDEHVVDGHTTTEGYSVVKAFTPEQSTSKVLEPYGCTEIRLSVALGLSDRFYPERASFKVLFVGRLDPWSEEGIKTSLLNALLASPGSSKSIMVRGQVEPYSPVLHAAHCTGVELQSKVGTPKRTILKLDGNDGEDLVLSHSCTKDSMPDLAIFCYPQSSSAPLSSSQYLDARLACREYGIPILDITDHRRFNDNHPGFRCSYEPTSLRVCVEGKLESDSFSKIDYLPVDVYTFMHLEPSDLNRHLAAINFKAQVPRSSSQARALASWEPSKFVPNRVKKAYGSVISADSTLKLGLLICTLIGLITTAHLIAPTSQSNYDSGIPVVATPQVWSSSNSAYSTAAITSNPIPSTISSASVKDKIDDFFAKQRQAVQVEKQRTTEDSRKSEEREEHLKAAARLREKLEKKKVEMRRREEVAKTTKIGGFEIQPSGDQQFILRPSKGFTGRTRKPQLQIQVTRDSKNVPIRYERSMEGVYVVDLEEHHPISSFNVSIATHSKPLMQQSFTIKLGYNKSFLGQWLSNFQLEGAVAQRMLGDAPSKVWQQFQTISARVTDKSQGLIGMIECAENEAASRVQEVKQHIDRRMNQARDGVWSSLRDKTAPVRTSRRTLWARNNAYVWRCGFERVIGLSSKDKDGKKTRSCQTVDW